ncbi:MAG: DedA family protein [Pirellulales bacterium]|jgi:membrane protein DedA with SNARE-associated domain|nr:DedA family protein [Pirellulales bacterium]
MIEWFERGSYLGIVLFLTLTGIGLPVPEEVPIIAAGVASRAEALQWYYALPACLLGALLGDSTMYAIGYFFGEKVLKEHPVWSGFLTTEREQKIESLIKKHGIKAFFLARFLVGLRSPFYLTAGILRVPYRWFLLADFICASVVITVFFGLSYAFGARIGAFIQSAERGLTIVVVSLTVLAVAAFLWFRRRRMQLLDENPERLFGNRELILGPASGSVGDTHEAAGTRDVRADDDAAAQSDVEQSDVEQPNREPAAGDDAGADLEEDQQVLRSDKVDA